MTDLLLGPLGRVVLVGSMYLILAVVVWLEARELAHATSTRVSPVQHRKTRRTPGRLVLVAGAGPAETPLSSPETLLGRDPSCHLRIPDGSVSSRHARVYQSDGEWFVEDLGSTNGTTVNDKLITHSVLLRPGDLVGIGRSQLEARA